MCARLLACPLCSQPGFLTLDALRAGLISVATRPLICPVCNEVLLGIDKLTIHLFSHTISVNTLNSTKHINIQTTSNEPLTVHNIQDGIFHDWNATKGEASELNKFSNNNLNVPHREESKTLTCVKDKILNPVISMQDKDVTVRSVPQVLFLPTQTCEGAKVNTFYQGLTNENITLNASKNSEDILNETLKLNCAVQYYGTGNNKDASIRESHSQIEQDNIETFKQWAPDQHCEQCTSSCNVIHVIKENKSGEHTPKMIEEFDNEQNTEKSSTVIADKEDKYLNFQSFPNITVNCTDAALETFSSEKNKNKESLNINIEDQTEALKHKEILPHLKAFKVLATKEKTERCNICGFHFPDYNILLLHKQLVHMIDEKDTNVIPEDLLKNYSCHLCSKVFKMRGSLMVHMRVAHIGYNLGTFPKDGQVEVICNESGYNCPTCGKKFKKEQHVIQHLKTHEAKQWECDICSKMFTTKYFLKKHKRLHSGEMPYKCNICNKTFTFQQSYHKHRLYHKDDKPHTCATCGRSFKELSTLHNHERIHTGEKPFACETCGKCFRQRVSYLVHRRIHTGVMPYKCTMCNKSFRYKVSQRTHKCPMQQTANIQQTTELDKKQIQLSESQSTNSELCKTKNVNAVQESQPMIHVIDNEANKYILIINPEGQHLLTRESNVNNAEKSDQEQKTGHAETKNDNKPIKDIWSPNIPNSPIFKKLPENCSNIHKESEKPSQEDENDFFSMVLSPLGDEICSPTTEMEHLRVSSPTQKVNIQKADDHYKNNSNNLKMNMNNVNLNDSFSSKSNLTGSLQTINEESLKQLLYGINDK